MTGQHKLLVTALVCVGVVCLLPRPVTSHGRLWDPPARNTMWRRGYNTPADYDDHSVNCGGFGRQDRLDYKCGTCGDAYDLPTPRPHEAGGKWGLGIIVKEYAQGEKTTFNIQLSSNQKGWFEFKLCPVVNNNRATQACLDAHTVQLADGSGSQYHLDPSLSGEVNVDVVLPPNLSCDQCVLQWHWHCQNRFNTNKTTGEACKGCGNQEEFYGCADIKINPSGSQAPAVQTTAPPPAQTQAPTSGPVQTQTPRPTQAPTAKPQQPINSANCKGVGERAGVWDAWCVETCGNGYCPDSMCVC